MVRFPPRMLCNLIGREYLVLFSGNEYRHRGRSAGFCLEGFGKNLKWFSFMFAGFIDFPNIKFKRQTETPNLLKNNGVYFLYKLQRGVFSEPVWLVCHFNRAKGPDTAPHLPPSCPSFICPSSQSTNESTGKISNCTLAIK